MTDLLVIPLRVSENIEPDVFGAFMQNEIFPALTGGPTRIGQADELTLLWVRPNSEEAGKQLYWLLVEGFMNDTFLNQVRDRLERFGVEIEGSTSTQCLACWQRTPPVEVPR